jgi:hypothetical protein
MTGSMKPAKRMRGARCPCVLNNDLNAAKTRVAWGDAVATKVTI